MPTVPRLLGDSTSPFIGNPKLFAKSLRDQHRSETSVTIAIIRYLTIVSWPSENTKHIVTLLDQRSARSDTTTSSIGPKAFRSGDDPRLRRILRNRARSDPRARPPRCAARESAGTSANRSGNRKIEQAAAKSDRGIRGEFEHGAASQVADAGIRVAVGRTPSSILVMVQCIRAEARRHERRLTNSRATCRRAPIRIDVAAGETGPRQTISVTVSPPGAADAAILLFCRVLA